MRLTSGNQLVWPKSSKHGSWFLVQAGLTSYNAQKQLNMETHLYLKYCLPCLNVMNTFFKNPKMAALN